MANDLYNYVAKSPVDSIIKWVDSSNVTHTIALPIAAGGSFNRQPELQRLTTVNCNALRTTAKRVEIGEDPIVQLTFGALSMPLLSMRQNRRWTSVSSATAEYFRSDYNVPADGVVAALANTTLGYEIAANAVSTASYIDDNGLSVDLVQDTNYASFDPAGSGNDLKFAVGANGAMKFGDGLWGKSVSFAIPVTYTNFYQLGNLPYTSMSLKVRAALVNLNVYEWVFDSVSINTEGEINFAAAEAQIGFYVEGAYTVKLYKKLAPC